MRSLGLPFAAQTSSKSLPSLMFRLVGCSMKLGAKSAVERKDKLNFLSWWGKCEKPSHCISSDKHHLGKQSGFHQFSVSSPRIFFFEKKAFVELAFVYLEKGTGLSISLCWFCLLFIRKQTEKKRSVSCFNASFGWSYRRRILKDLWLSRNLWKHSYLLLALLHECTAKRGYFAIEWSRIRNLNVWFFSLIGRDCLFVFSCLFLLLLFSSWRKQRHYTFPVTLCDWRTRQQRIQRKQYL